MAIKPKGNIVDPVCQMEGCMYQRLFKSIRELQEKNDNQYQNIQELLDELEEYDDAE